MAGGEGQCTYWICDLCDCDIRTCVDHVRTRVDIRPKNGMESRWDRKWFLCSDLRNPSPMSFWSCGRIDMNKLNIECKQRLVIDQKKSSALALEIVSPKCNALVIMH